MYKNEETAQDRVDKLMKNEELDPHTDPVCVLAGLPVLTPCPTEEAVLLSVQMENSALSALSGAAWPLQGPITTFPNVLRFWRTCCTDPQ